MPRKKNSKMLHPPKSPLMFAERPKEIPHKFLSPIQCCAFPISAQSTLVHDCDFLWVSPQFTHLNEHPLRKVRRKCKQKVFPESENVTPHKKYKALKFISGSATDSSAYNVTPCSSRSTMTPCSSSRSTVTHLKPKRTVFKDVHPIIQIEDVLDTSVCSEVDDTLKAVPPLSYLHSLFDTTSTEGSDLGDVLVPETPEREYTMTIRQRQMKNMKSKSK